MTNEQLQQLARDTFSGLAIFCRDAQFDRQFLLEYQSGMILTDRGFKDMSYKMAGLTANCRYLIASNQARDVSAFNPQAGHWGLVVLQPGARFKVLDVQYRGDKTQVLLLHIPETYVEFFRQMDFDLEDRIREKALQNFEQNLQVNPLPELQEPGWISRTALPLGMDEEGNLF